MSHGSGVAQIVNGVNDYLDLAKEIIQEFGITEDDPRLVISMPKAGKLPITVNQRYVLSGMPNGTVGLIMPCDYTPPGRGEKVDPNYFFNCMHIREALWVEFSFPQRIKLPEKVIKCWKMSVEEEMARGGKRSGFRRFHQPLAYTAVVDDTYRKFLLEDAFGV